VNSIVLNVFQRQLYFIPITTTAIDRTVVLVIGGTEFIGQE